MFIPVNKSRLLILFVKFWSSPRESIPIPIQPYEESIDCESHFLGATQRYIPRTLNNALSLHFPTNRSQMETNIAPAEIWHSRYMRCSRNIRVHIPMSKRMNAEEGIQREVGMEFSQPE